MHIQMYSFILASYIYIYIYLYIYIYINTEINVIDSNF